MKTAQMNVDYVDLGAIQDIVNQVERLTHDR